MAKIQNNGCRSKQAPGDCAFAPSSIRHLPSSLSRRRRGFTLVELMVSIAIALVLIYGVNQVFRIGAQTVGAGQAFSEITRDERTAHFQVYTDVHNAVIVNCPALIISSQRTWAFRDLADFVSEPSGTASTVTINGAPQQPSNLLLGPRNYRIDTLGFFASGDLYQRQTADLGYFESPLTSSSAYIWYGHLVLPNNAVATGKTASTGTTGFFEPGNTMDLNGAAGTNDNNLYAADWTLGRFAMLLASPSSLGTAPNASFIPASTSGNPPPNPLAYNTMSNDGVNAIQTYAIQTSRYDVLGAALNYFNAFNTPALRNGMVFRPTSTGLAQYNIFRYEANPFPSKPLNSTSMAGTAPIFLQHCSQFIVEYAGDYLTQDNNPYLADGVTANPNYGNVGSITNASGTQVAVNGAQGDGVVDFVVDKSAGPSPAQWVRKVRWYGFPRDTNNDGVIDMMHDVVPLRDVLQAAMPYGAGQSSAIAPWEAFSPTFPPAPTGANPNTYNYIGTVHDSDQYINSWGVDSVWPLTNGSNNGLPRMLRITVALDDPNGRLAGPQVYEYVIDLGSQQ